MRRTTTKAVRTTTINIETATRYFTVETMSADSRGCSSGLNIVVRLPHNLSVTSVRFLRGPAHCRRRCAIAVVRTKPVCSGYSVRKKRKKVTTKGRLRYQIAEGPSQSGKDQEHVRAEGVTGTGGTQRPVCGRSWCDLISPQIRSYRTETQPAARTGDHKAMADEGSDLP